MGGKLVYLAIAAGCLHDSYRERFGNGDDHMQVEVKRCSIQWGAAMVLRRVVWLCVGVVLLTGCAAGGDPSSKQQPFCVLALSVSPQSGSADHMAAAPGNQVKFGAAYGPTEQSSCKLPTVLVTNATWTSSDPVDVQVSSAPGDPNGLATCLSATSAPLTVTASYTPTGAAAVSGTAAISCR